MLKAGPDGRRKQELDMADDGDIFSAVVKSSTSFHSSPYPSQTIPVYAQKGMLFPKHENHNTSIPSQTRRRWLVRIVFCLVTTIALLIYHQNHAFCSEKTGPTWNPVCEFYIGRVQPALRPTAHMLSIHTHPRLQSAYLSVQSISHAAHETARHSLDRVHLIFIEPQQRLFAHHEIRQKFQEVINWLEKTSLREATDQAHICISMRILDLQDKLRQMYVDYLSPIREVLVDRFFEHTENLKGYLDHQLQQKGGDNTLHRIRQSFLFHARNVLSLLGQKDGPTGDYREAVETARMIVAGCKRSTEKDHIEEHILTEKNANFGQDSPLDELGETYLTMVALEIQNILALAQQTRQEIVAQLDAVKDVLEHPFNGLSEHKASLLAEALKSEIQLLKLTGELCIRDRVQEALSRVKKADCRAWQRDRMVGDIKAAQKSALKEMRQSLDLLVLQCNLKVDQQARKANIVV